jgi:hypothetical protein
MNSPPIVSNGQYRSPSSILPALSSQEATEHPSKCRPYDRTPVKLGVAVVELLLLSVNLLVADRKTNNAF